MRLKAGVKSIYWQTLKQQHIHSMEEIHPNSLAQNQKEEKKKKRKEINIFSTQNWAENGNLHQVELTEP